MSHELNGIMILIHPPLAILGYLFTLLALKKAVQVSFFKKSPDLIKDLNLSLAIAWWLTFFGLITGMIWAQIAWGSFWSWDPKETSTLFVFLTLTAAYVSNMAKLKPLFIFITLLVNAVCILVTISMSLVSFGLHSFG
jgi:ABC-type transport system involved in cytochrome c biogenesis permease subunit